MKKTIEAPKEPMQALKGNDGQPNEESKSQPTQDVQKLDYEGMWKEMKDVYNDRLNELQQKEIKSGQHFHDAKLIVNVMNFIEKVEQSRNTAAN